MVLSTFTVVAFEVKMFDLTKMDPAGGMARGISSAYCDCMSNTFGIARESVAAAPEPDPASEVVYLSGPWAKLGWVGKSILTIAAGHKWGVFLTDADAQVDVVRNTYCVAKALDCAKALIFDSDGMALELASEGRPLEDVMVELETKPLLKRFCVATAADAAIVASEIGLFEDATHGYFEIDFSHNLESICQG